MTEPLLTLGNSREITGADVDGAILRVMSDGEIKRPKTVFALLRRYGWSYKTIANHMAKLAKEGKLIRVRKGWYRAALPQPSPEPTHGVGTFEGHHDPPRVHDVWIVWRPPNSVSLPSLVKEVRAGNTTIRVQFGAKRRKITIVLANDYPGLDYDGYLLSLELALSIVADVVGFRPPLGQLRVVNVQLNRDHRYVRLDGLKSLTVGEFGEMMARWYQKTEDTVREEVVPSRELSAEALAAAMSAGLSASQAVQLAYQVLMGFNQLQRTLEHLLEQGKMQIKLFQALLGRVS